MAIDTIQEKASVLNLGVPWYTVGPMLSGIFGEAEFWHLLHLYASEEGVVDSTQSTATVPNGTVGVATSITVQAKNALGVNITTGGEMVVVNVTGTNTATPTVTDVGDGTYTASYTPTAAGADSVAITMGGTAISGSPYTSTVAAANGTVKTMTGFSVNPCAILRI